MHDRACNECGLSWPAPLDSFTKSKTAKYGRRNTCKKCDAERRMPTYSRPTVQINRWLLRAMSSGPCTDCGFEPTDPCQMDFDHVRGEKLMQPGLAILRATRKFVEEINKCELVCANCHRLRTHIMPA